MKSATRLDLSLEFMQFPKVLKTWSFSAAKKGENLINLSSNELRSPLGDLLATTCGHPPAFCGNFQETTRANPTQRNVNRRTP